MMSTIQEIENHLNNVKREDLVSKRWQEKPLGFDIRDIYWRYLPASNRYYSELNASFVYEYASLQTMGTYPFILLRDGFYGLAYFFMKNPKPIEHLQTKILVPAPFKSLIPKKWVNNTLIYEHEFKSENLKYTHGVYYGHLTQDSILVSSVKQKVEKSFNKDTEIYINTFCKDRFFKSNENHKTYFFDFLQEVYRKYGFEIEQSSYHNDMDWNKVGEQWAFYNLDTENFITCSDYLTFLYASKGGTYINKPKRLIEESDVIKRIELSPYHSLIISNPKNLTDNILQSLIKLKISGVPLDLGSEKLYDFLLSEFKSFLKNDLRK